MKTEHLSPADGIKKDDSERKSGRRRQKSRWKETE